jgi:L-seryl-tRNA(Ser) seleniumtransferase
LTALDPRRTVPRTDALLADPAVLAAIERLGSARVRTLIAEVQDRVRSGLLAPDRVVDEVMANLPGTAGSLRRVINATGVVLHTNLGRARLSAAAAEAIGAAAGYVDIEFDLAEGTRARRGRGTAEVLLKAVPGAEAVLVVNNGAAALLLATTVLAHGRDVIVSRGELVEIGDGFRLPELISAGGARIREVGSTNRTELSDYRQAVTAETGCLLKVHPSNFVISGFTSTVRTAALAGIAGPGVPLVVDVGSGLLRPDPALPAEPDVSSTLAEGADLVTCSADKLLGGPQAGLIFGRAVLIGRIRRHPLARALRVDKLTLAGLEASVQGPRTPTWRYLHTDPEVLRRRCLQIAATLSDQLGSVKVVPSDGAVGGGGAPGQALPGWALALPAHFAAGLRGHDPPVACRVSRGRCLVDLRCVDDEEDPLVAAAISAIARR